MDCSIAPDTRYDLNLFSFEFERQFDFCQARDLVNYIYAHYSHHLLIGYLVTIFSIKNYMANRKPYDLKRPLVAWNFFLSIFSAIGALKTGSELVKVWQHEGLQGTICHSGYHHGVTGLWTFLFIMSKMPEFIDTLFIVLRKKPLIFLHWYHHVETCWFALFSYGPNFPLQRWGVVLNFTVHAIMYFYYALKGMNISIPKQISMCITSMQTVQMFIAIFVGIKALTYENFCGNSKETIVAGFFTYGVYAFLFSRYFYKSYLCKKSSRPVKPLDVKSLDEAKKGA